MPANRSTYLDDDVDAIVAEIAAERKWTVSTTIAELVAQSPMYREKAAARESARKRQASAAR